MKKIILILLLLISMLQCTMYAAVVSDADGATFVTKAEFESLKNSLNTQINGYNESISKKIDGMIALYLDKSKLPTKQVLKNAKSILKYPITIRNSDDTYTVAKWNALTNGNSWWEPSFSAFETYGNTYNDGTNGVLAVNAIVCKLDRRYKSATVPNLNTIKNFYNAKSWDAATGKCVIDKILLDYDCKNSFNALWWPTYNGWSIQSTGNFYLRDDQRIPENRNDGVWNLNFNNIRADGSDLWNTSEPPNIKISCYITNGVGDVTFQNNYTSMTKTAGGGSFWSDRNGTNTDANYEKKKMNSCSVTSVSQEYFNELYTGAKSILLPMAYNEVVYYTNNSKQKIDIFSNTKYDRKVCSAKPYYNNTTVPGWNNNLKSYITSGFTVEPEGAAAPYNVHPWYNRSLINTSHIYYDVKTENNNGNYEQSINEGLLLTDVNMTGGFEYAKLTLNIQQENTTNPKYLLVSQNPITEYNPSSITSANYYDLYKTSGYTGTPTKMFQLSSGENNIYFKDLPDKSNIYIKIIWNNSDTTYVKLMEEPSLEVDKL